MRLVAAVVLVSLSVACVTRRPYAPEPFEPWSTPDEPPRVRRDQAAPPPPPTRTTPPESLAARPPWWRAEPKEFAPPSRLRVPSVSSEVSPGGAAGLWCRFGFPEPSREGTWAQRVVLGDLHVDVWPNEDSYVFVPLVSAETDVVLALSPRFLPKADLLGLAIGILTVVPLPFILHDLRARPGAGMELKLEGTPPWKLQVEEFTAECLPASGAEAEAALVPALKDAVGTLVKARPAEQDLDQDLLGVRSFSEQYAADRIAHVASLVGWADPRVRELVARYDAVVFAYREELALRVQSQAEVLPQSGPFVLLSGRATITEATLDCREPKKPRHRSETPPDCVIRLTVRNDGPGTLAVRDALWPSVSVFGADGSHLTVTEWESLRPIAPGKTLEVLGDLRIQSGATLTPPLLLRVRSSGPLEVLGDDEARYLPSSGVTLKLSSLEGDRVRATLSVDAGRQVAQYTSLHFGLVSMCTGETVGSLSSPLGTWGFPETMTFTANVYRPVPLCPELSPFPLAAQLSATKGHDFLRLTLLE